jgi:hypothetical protein
MDSRSRGLGFESPAPTSEHGNAMVSGSHQEWITGKERRRDEGRGEGEDKREAEGDRKGEGKMGCEKGKDGKKRKGDEKERIKKYKGL